MKKWSLLFLLPLLFFACKNQETSSLLKEEIKIEHAIIISNLLEERKQSQNLIPNYDCLREHETLLKNSSFLIEGNKLIDTIYFGNSKKESIK